MVAQDFAETGLVEEIEVGAFSAQVVSLDAEVFAVADKIAVIGSPLFIKEGDKIVVGHVPFQKDAVNGFKNYTGDGFAILVPVNGFQTINNFIHSNKLNLLKSLIRFKAFGLCLGFFALV